MKLYKLLEIHNTPRNPHNKSGNPHNKPSNFHNKPTNPYNKPGNPLKPKVLFLIIVKYISFSVRHQE